MKKSPLWQLNEAVLFGEAGGRIIWQPRIGCCFTDRRFAGEPLPLPFTGKDLPDVFRNWAVPTACTVTTTVVSSGSRIPG